MAGLTKPLVCAVLACLALALGAQASPATASDDARCPDAELTPDRDNLDRVRDATLCLLNLERADHGLAPLEADAQLARAAQGYSRRMVRERFFAHVSPGGSTLTKRIRKGTRYISASVRDWSLGENLAWGSRRLSTPRAIVAAWMRSAGHRRNILDERFRDIGIGVASGAPAKVSGPAATYTTEFGYRDTT